MNRKPGLTAVVVALAALLILVPSVSAAPRPWPVRALTSDHLTGLTANHELASDGSTLHLVYVHEPTAFLGDLLYRRSSDGGQSWTAPQTLFSTGGRLTELVGNLGIAAGGDLVVVTFRARDADDALLFTVASHDGGKTWGKRVRIARSSAPRMGIPSISLSSAGVIVGWTDRTNGRIYTRLSSDQAVTFEPAQLIATTRFSFICGNPAYTDGFVSLAADGDHAYVNWTSDPAGGCNPATLLLRRSTDGGRTWRPRQHLPDTAGTLGWPEMAAKGRSVVLFVQLAAAGNLLLRSTDAGRTFTDQALLPDNPATLATSGDVDYAPDGSLRLVNGEYTVAPDGRFSSSVLVTRRSADGGATWGSRSIAASAPDRLIDSAPNLAFAGTSTVVAFNQSDGSGTVQDIMLARLGSLRVP